MDDLDERLRRLRAQVAADAELLQLVRRRSKEAHAQASALRDEALALVLSTRGSLPRATPPVPTRPPDEP